MGEKRLLAFCALAGVLLYGVSAGVRGDIGLLLNPVAASSGQSYEGVSIAIALMQLAFGATQPLFGWLAMRRSNRFVLTLGAVSYAVGLALLPYSLFVSLSDAVYATATGYGTLVLCCSLQFTMLYRVVL